MSPVSFLKDTMKHSDSQNPYSDYAVRTLNIVVILTQAAKMKLILFGLKAVRALYKTPSLRHTDKTTYRLPARPHPVTFYTTAGVI